MDLPVLALSALLALSPVSDPLAGTGRLAVSSCPEEKLVDGGIPRPREYLIALTRCLDASWNAHFRRARLPYGKPVVLYFEEPRERVCGIPWPVGVAAFYCTERRTLVFPLEGRWIEGREDLYPLKVAAHEYGHHVQQLSGLRAFYEKRARGGYRSELSRRYELQADCLAGVFLGSVWASLERTPKDWADLLDQTRAHGDQPEEPRSHGSGAVRAYWLKRGFTTVSPASCDTWKASAARVS